MRELLDFGVVTFDSDYNPDYNRFHVRAEVNITGRENGLVFDIINIEISHNGKTVESGNNFQIIKTILEHSKLGNNEKFQVLSDIYLNSSVSLEEGQRITKLWKKL